MADIAAQLDPSQAARKVELIVAQLDSLPTLPRIATQLLRLTRCDEASTRQVIELIKQDQAVTAKILSLARRAGSGIRGEANTIDKCVPLMGLEAVSSAALSVKIFEIFPPGGKGDVGSLDLIGFWKHSLAVAVTCEQLAVRLAKKGPAGTRTPAPDEVFVAGLLHDIGKAALHLCLPKAYNKVIESAEATHAPLLALERRLIGIDHTVVGKRLAQRWDLPQGVLDAIWLHHGPPAAMPESVRQRMFAPIVFLADLIVRELRIGYSGNYPRLTDSPTAAAAMGISGEELDAVRRAVPSELANRASLIGIDDLDSRDLYHEALTGANQELAQLNARLISRGLSLSNKVKYFDLLGELNRRLRPGSRPIEVAQLIGQLFLPLSGASRLVVFSEPPTFSASAPDGMIEGVVLDVSVADSLERFMLAPAQGEVNGLAAARRGGWFDPAQSAEGFALYPLDTHLSWVHHRLGNPLPLENCYFLPLVGESVWVGGLVFSARGGGGQSPGSMLGGPGSLLAGWPSCRAELFALCSAAGGALRTAQAISAADQVAEELAQASEQCARLQDELIRQKALASVGQMAAGAGHELNNPLTVISGRSELLAADESDPKRREALEQIRQNAQRASGIISEIMTFARPPQAHPQKIDLADFVHRMIAPLRQGRIEVSEQADANLPPAFADPDQLREVVQEILDNAQQAMAAQDADRRLEVRIAEAPRDSVAPLGEGGQNNGRLLEVVIADRGVGMEPFVLEHATDPFFSARPAGRGRGLGLARARRLIEHNGGAIHLESQPQAGTTVRIHVPAMADN